MTLFELYTIGVYSVVAAVAETEPSNLFRSSKRRKFESRYASALVCFRTVFRLHLQ
jgi:hypothetical protein